MTARGIGRRLLSGSAALLAAGGLLVLAPAGPARDRVEAATATGSGSAVTVHGAQRGNEDFSQLAITVSQTGQLVNQAITISWTGGAPTPRNRELGVDYLQIMQCWGDPRDPADPDGLRFRETCQFGLNLDMPRPAQLGSPSTHAGDRVIATRQLGAGYPDWDPGETLPRGTNDQQTVPFRTVGGAYSNDGGPDRPYKRIPLPNNPQQTREETPTEALLPYFGPQTTNEYPYALTSADGTGRVAFEVQNAALAPYLGCGAPYTDASGAQRPARPCSLVIVPRGHFHPYADPPKDVRPSQHAVDGSPFLPALWQHRIVVPLDFDPVAGFCPQDAEERRTAGSELIAEAITAWQPALCAGNGPVYGYSTVGDAEANRQVLLTDPGAPGLVFTADPVSPAAGQPRVVHAPVALSSVVLALNVDANITDPSLGSVPPEIQQVTGSALRTVKLTPRLVAKLLTQSYKRDAKSPLPSTNPDSVRFDREFLDLNPIFAYWDTRLSATLDGLMVSAGSSSAARQVWQWILADPEARDWLTGTADQYGMVVNPSYKIFGSAPVDYFPKADAFCTTTTFQEREYKHCTLDYRPYQGSFEEAALQTLRADTKGRDPLLNTIDLANGLAQYPRIPRRTPGYRFAMSVTASSSAARYELFTAALCKPIRDSAGRYLDTDCRSPDPAAISAAAATATAGAVPGVRAIDPARAWAAGAYPLTVLTYAVANTAQPADARRDYARLIRHAAGPGQVSGPAAGQLPAGYVPLPQDLRNQALAAATTLENWVTPTTPAANGGGAPPPAAPPAAGPPEAPPSAGSAPSPAPQATSPRPQTVGSTTLTPADRLGALRYLLVGLLGVGLLSGIVGPVLRRIGSGSRASGGES
ncbi:hypothetical protein [Rhizomonospora bruguierae]|uniref:hypothetical protein n=1 Tax=Rhizomonospora bruguierae TaxID=1581705 RepID=UPI001BCC23B5|nr:hypothetical protein [Micromonospora sp. NBRC 107566]